MADKCCVPGCRSNYRGQEQAPLFAFPPDPDLQEKWLKLIGRRDYVVNKNSFVCVKHFQPDFLKTVHHVDQGDGTVLCVPRIIPKLQTRALPTIFLHASSSSSAELPRVTTKFKDKKDTNVTGDLEISQQSCLIKDGVASFHSLCNNNDSHIHQWMNRSNLAVTCTDNDRPRCDQMTRKGQLGTKHTAAQRPGFTEMCQSIGTVTKDVEDVKPTILTQPQPSLELPDSLSGYGSRSTPSGT